MTGIGEGDLGAGDRMGGGEEDGLFLGVLGSNFEMMVILFYTRLAGGKEGVNAAVG